MIKDDFKELGLQIKEIADLLFVPESTLRTWFRRESTIPLQYSGYISGLNVYQAKYEQEDLDTIYNYWKTNNNSLLVSQKTKTLQQLAVDFAKNDLAMHKMQIRKNQLIRRLHLSVHFPNYLNENLKGNENLKDWCSLMQRRATFDLGDLQLKIQKLEEKKASIEAKMGFWEKII